MTCSWQSLILGISEVFFKIKLFYFWILWPNNFFLIMKINIFWGDLSGTSAKTATLLGIHRVWVVMWDHLCLGLCIRYVLFTAYYSLVFVHAVFCFTRISTVCFGYSVLIFFLDILFKILLWIRSPYVFLGTVSSIHCGWQLLIHACSVCFWKKINCFWRIWCDQYY